MSIAPSRSSIRYVAVALPATVALALAGCGSSASSSSSHSVAASPTTTAETSSNPAAKPVSLTTASPTTSPERRMISRGKGFVAAIPSGFRNATASAQGGPINVLYLATGPRVASLTTNINVVREPSHGATDIDAITRAEVSGIKLTLSETLRISAPKPLTVAGEPARAVDYQYGPATRRLHLRQVIVEHAGWIYVITYAASSKGYAASLPALAQVIHSWRWS